MVEIVNIVASGSLGIELDLENVYGDIGPIGKYDPKKYPGMYFRFEEDAPLITLYRTGKYIVTGADSKRGGLFNARPLSQSARRAGDD